MVQHIAGRSPAKKMADLIEAIKAAGFPHDRYRTTTIINIDDAIPGTGCLYNSIGAIKALPMVAIYHVDSNGCAEARSRIEKSSIVVLDKNKACAVG